MPPSTPYRALHISLWVVQILLGAGFMMAGIMKLGTPAAQLVADGMTWAGRVPGPLIKFIGASEVLGAVGLILPAATRIQPRLTPLAAAGLVVVMLLAAGEHGRNGEFGMLPVNFMLGAFAAFVAWGRLRAAPIAERGTGSNLGAAAQR